MTATAHLDFRSDTVTLPDPVMCAAMGRAELGDDVLDGDPTMRRLEERAATVLGTEAALWVPSGSMGNLIALFLQVQRGERLLAPAQAHVLDQEVGTAFWLAGATPGPLPWRVGAPAGRHQTLYGMRLHPPGRTSHCVRRACAWKTPTMLRAAR